MLGGTFFSAISQILLKQSANIKYSNPLREYLNWRVILAYFLFFGILLLHADSLDLFELAMALEEEFSVEIPSEDLEKITTVADAMNYLTEHQA